MPCREHPERDLNETEHMYVKISRQHNGHQVVCIVSRLVRTCACCHVLSKFRASIMVTRLSASSLDWFGLMLVVTSCAHASVRKKINRIKARHDIRIFMLRPILLAGQSDQWSNVGNFTAQHCEDPLAINGVIFTASRPG